MKEINWGLTYGIPNTVCPRFVEKGEILVNAVYDLIIHMHMYNTMRAIACKCEKMHYIDGYFHGILWHVNSINC